MARDDDSGDEDRDDVPDSEEEEVEQEWHFWLLGLVALAGVALVVLRPEIYPNLGYFVLALVVVGWLLKEVLERMM